MIFLNVLFEVMTDINTMIYDRSLEDLACIYGVIFIEMRMGS